MKDIDRYRGCLLGGAAGDALGYEVEFLDETAIFARFGEEGITEYVLRNGVAEISDDTQMTLFTVDGLLLGTERGLPCGSMGACPELRGLRRAAPLYADAVYLSYKDWYRTQTERFPLPEKRRFSRLVNVPELFSRRAPGNTCLSALAHQTRGTIEEPLNYSKGCGGIMRVAPVGLYFDGGRYPLDEIDRIGAETAALTHGHPLGYIPAAGLVHIIHLVSHSDDMTIREAVEDMEKAIARQFADNRYLREFLDLVDRARALSENEDLYDLDAIRQLGQGWVAEETLAIAIYCSLKYSDDFDKALIASVNHGGDSDSTGAVTGNIVGAYLGLKGIPLKYLAHLELRDVIFKIADELYSENRV